MNQRPDRSKEMDAFLARVGWAGAQRSPLAGDASFRRYERVRLGDRIAVLMDAPPPWEDVRPFIAMTQRFRECTASVPDIIAADEAQGFLLLEDLGDRIFTRVLAREPQQESLLYQRAVEALLAIQRHGGAQHAVPTYDESVYLREVALFAEWFLPQVVGIERARAVRADYLALWQRILRANPLAQTCLVHRDYHADNLLWLERPGIGAVGMLDYQDALWGDPAYDLVSLLEDARRDVAPETVQACCAQFIQGSGMAAPEFAWRYALLGAQRNAKIIGIFTRLCVRDGKPHYLDYLPRVWGHFLNDVAHPALQPIAQFVEAHVPKTWQGRFEADSRIGGIA